MAKIFPLFSGSSGNSFYISAQNQAILIDAGKSAKQIELAIKNKNLDIKSIKAIFITHEHTDHVQGLRVFASRYKIKVYASEGTISQLEKKNILNSSLSYKVMPGDGICIGSINIKGFHTSHDAAESMGFIINIGNQNKISLVTDLGFISEDIITKVKGSNVVILESNHDIYMLQNGSYPYELKKRILSDKGHLSNEACAKVLPTLLKSGTTRFLLAHLSQKNNFDKLALQTSLCELQKAGAKRNFDFLIQVLPPMNNQNVHITL